MKPINAEQDVLCLNRKLLMMSISSCEPTAFDTGLKKDKFDASDPAFWDIKIVLRLINATIDYPLFWLRRWRVKRLKRKWLPNFPQTLVCPACLTVLPRKGKVQR